jgi:hypothetical protein
MNDSAFAALPHHKLVAFEVARELLLTVRACHIRDANLRDQASRSSKSACLNTAEAMVSQCTPWSDSQEKSSAWVLYPVDVTSILSPRRLPLVT